MYNRQGLMSGVSVVAQNPPGMHIMLPREDGVPVVDSLGVNKLRSAPTDKK